METSNNTPPEEVIMSITADGNIKTQEAHIQPTTSTDQILFVRVSTEGTDGIIAHTLAIEALQRNTTLKEVAKILEEAGIDIIAFEE